MKFEKWENHEKSPKIAILSTTDIISLAPRFELAVMVVHLAN